MLFSDLYTKQTILYITLYFMGKMFDCSKSGLEGESLDL
jgi:hypothetical protein